MHNEGFLEGNHRPGFVAGQLRAEETDPPEFAGMLHDGALKEAYFPRQFHGFGPIAIKQSCEFSFLHLLRAMLGAEKGA